MLRPVQVDGKSSAPSYHLVWAPGPVTREEAVAGHGRRHQIEQLFEDAKGRAGLDQYEVRSYVGWHHHTTLSLLALWFLCLERLEQGKQLPR